MLSGGCDRCLALAPPAAASENISVKVYLSVLAIGLLRECREQLGNQTKSVQEAVAGAGGSNPIKSIRT